MSLTPFEKQIVTFVRQMPDEGILALVRSQLQSGAPIGQGAPVAAATSAKPAPAKASKPKKAAKATRSKRRGGGKKAQLLERVLAFVLSSDGVAAKDVAEGLGIPRTRASALLRELKQDGQIIQAGDRRFARYAATHDVAQAASDAARGSA